MASFSGVFGGWVVGWGSKILTMLIACFGKFVYHLWFDKLNEMGVFTVLSYAEKKVLSYAEKKKSK